MSTQQKRKAKKSSIPEWMGNYPFPPDKKKPVVIRKDKEVSLIYGLGDHLDSTPMYVSTDKLYFCEYTVPAGDTSTLRMFTPEMSVIIVLKG